MVTGTAVLIIFRKEILVRALLEWAYLGRRLWSRALLEWAYLEGGFSTGLGIFRREALVHGTAVEGIFRQEALVPGTTGVGILRKKALVPASAGMGIFMMEALVPGTAGVGIFRKKASAVHEQPPTRIRYARFPLSVVLG